MRIVNTFISDVEDIPPYTEICLRQARLYNPEVEIDFISRNPAKYFNELKINWINQSDVKSELLSEFNDLSWFGSHKTESDDTTYHCPSGFWQKTAERIFCVQAHIKRMNLSNVFHFENDVLLYGSLQEVETTEHLTVTPMRHNQTTFAFTHIPNAEKMDLLCRFMNWLLSSYGQQQLQGIMGDHISEMSLLNLAIRERVISGFPTLPLTKEAGPTDGGPYYSGTLVFDPGSYGQFLGGTNNGHSSGFTDPQHFIGEAINNGQLDIVFDGTPSVNGVKIFNLHIHSKNLKEFVNV
tara:strand:- start:177 stop:1061 length:885 start_codon:yes stop_codon:yes gene_type:complete